DEHVPYLIRVREDPASVLAPVPADAAVAKEEREQRNLYFLGIAMRLLEWSEGRAEELATVLMKLLGDESAVMRRGAVNVIAASAVKVEMPARQADGPFGLLDLPKDGSLPSILPYLDPEGAAKPATGARPMERPQKSKVALCLDKQRVEDRLRKLR